ncbi:MAG: hypothetical protein ACM3O8_15395 [Methylococcaceae bacterium]|nr:hypothetical protein [Prolixibacteraceae bacterium]
MIIVQHQINDRSDTGEVKPKKGIGSQRNRINKNESALDKARLASRLLGQAIVSEMEDRLLGSKTGKKNPST